MWLVLEIVPHFPLFPLHFSLLLGYCFFKHLLLNFVLVYAEVAELVDALDSGSSGRKPVWVQVPSSAPIYHHWVLLLVYLRFSTEVAWLSRNSQRVLQAKRNRAKLL